MISIKKYPNRRLYDTSQSKYVNLDYIRELIKGHKEFEVVDSKSGEDLTKSILLQIITESESNHQQSLLTDVLLKQLIRFYDSDMQVFVRQYLEQSILSFLQQQEKMQSMLNNMTQANPVNMFSAMMEDSLKNFSSWTDKDKKKP
ncbi:polyhydroxyalkanoate synthesis repressor PhaR [Alteromonas sediminis]|uniref:Polyhydroxyalkanoate synthesis repressor PhaR n=1 Tax=Alteromonas sediminis TaxID=2259342 RepID=A0A3N5Z7M4_9ALTE|nr:polyhydroxyalkanoate synthesis repressor PhaR [Alteromonas sediminis]RPJ64848.1 polyhydroxyalkanoate synthesis repressor PhaR [Alteromonas sediminis]